MRINETKIRISNFLKKRSKLILWTALLSTFLVGAGYSIFLEESFRYGDEKEYFVLANNIAYKSTYSYDGANPTAWRPPGYPLFLSIFRYLGAEFVHFRFLNYLSLCSSILLIYAILKQYSKLTATIGIIMVAFSPVFFYTASTLYPQTLGSTLLLSSIWILFKSKKPSPGEMFVNGLILGYLCLTIPTFLFTSLFTFCWFLLQEKPGKLIPSMSLIIGMMVVLTPWTARNYHVFEKFVLISTNGGKNFLLGNSENTLPTSGVNTDISRYKARNFEDEVEKDRYYLSKALKYIWNNKLKSFQMYLRKFGNYFNYWNLFATQTEASTIREILLLVSYGFLLSLSMVRIGCYRKYPLISFDWFLISLYVLNGAVAALFFTRIRLRLPFDFLLILLNARFLGNLLRVEPKRYT